MRLRALPSGAGNVPRSREPTAADEASLYQRQLKRQRQRAWLEQLKSSEGGGGGGSVSRSMPPGHGFAGRLSSAPNSLARSLEAGGGGVDEAASLARARLQLQQRQLLATEQYRHEHRQERLTRLLQGSAQLTRYIYPHYGSVEFVELPFRNPYSTEHAFTVVWDDPMGHLSLVTSLDEWRALKARHKLSTPAEEELVLQGQRLWLMPQELVYIPIKFQALTAIL